MKIASILHWNEFSLIPLGKCVSLRRTTKRCKKNKQTNKQILRNWKAPLHEISEYAFEYKLSIRDRSQTLVRGGGWCKKYLSRKFFGPPFRLQKISGPPFLPWKLRVNPIEKHVNSIFNGKSVVIFFRAPLTRVKNFKGPPFCIRPPLQVFMNGP